jgi:hypothetical protein
MKKYGRCPKFGRGDNSTCTFMKRRRATPPKQLIGFFRSFFIGNLLKV